ncbi:MAG TPA: nuclear transport factor 2 family protein [Candidatus Binatia bacterium]|nr:nuclear transport factor 2 family protein [Candidatus Binatia bacterium]
MRREDAVRLARHWIDCWNGRDLEAVLGHFDEAARFTSPRAIAVFGRGTVEGLAELRGYWQARLAQIDSLRFTLDRVLWDDEQRTMVILYVADVNGQKTRACEVLRFGEDGRAVEGEAMYGAML